MLRFFLATPALVPRALGLLHLRPVNLGPHLLRRHPPRDVRGNGRQHIFRRDSVVHNEVNLTHDEVM